jgi:hypothetical protein
MTTPPWGHKPPTVDDVERYWHTPPPELSTRARYWLRRLDEGTWRANRRLRHEGYHTAAEMLGIYIYEWLEVVWPAALTAADQDDLRRAAQPLRWV